MSWDEMDIMGDDPQDEMFGTEVYNSEPLAEGTEYDLDDYDDYIEEDGDYSEYEDADYDEDVLDISDIDFSGLDGKNLKADLKKVNRAVANKKVVSRTKSRAITSTRPNPRVVKGGSKPTVKGKPISVKPTRPLVQKQNRPLAQKPTRPLVQKPTSANKPILKPKANPKLTKGGAPKSPISQKRVDVPVKRRAVIQAKKGRKTTEKIYVPEDRTVIVEGVDRFMLANNKNSEAIKNIGYYKGEKLKEMVLIINNTTPNDIDLELFNPSEPLDYLYSTSQNLNNIVSVAGNNLVQYSDVLFNLLANPALLPSAKFTVTGLQVQAQFNQPLIFKNKNVAGFEKIHPIQNNLNIDIDQNQKQIVYWNILDTLGRAFIPDGMDVIKYKVLAGNSVVFGFYYKQVSLKRFFYQEARDKRIL